MALWQVLALCFFHFCHWATAEKEAIQAQLYAGSSHLIVGLFGRLPAKEFW